MTTTVPSLHFCKTLSSGKSAAPTGKQGAFYTPSKLWPQNSEVHVAFINGTDQQKKWVKKTVLDNYGPQYINLNVVFDEVVRPNTDIRVKFDPADGSWSAIGTDAKTFDSRDPTLNLGWLDDDKDFGVIKHEFGHALMGWNHEHDSPLSNPIQWNKPVVYKALSGPPNNWDQDTIDENMFTVYSPENVKGSAWDKSSIMEYFFPKEWTLNGVSLSNIQKLSDIDRRVQRMAYPIPDKKTIATTRNTKSAPTTTSTSTSTSSSISAWVFIIPIGIVVLLLIILFVSKLARESMH